jgi:hypothetical protein
MCCRAFQWALPVIYFLFHIQPILILAFMFFECVCLNWPLTALPLACAHPFPPKLSSILLIARACYVVLKFEIRIYPLLAGWPLLFVRVRVCPFHQFHQFQPALFYVFMCLCVCPYLFPWLLFLMTVRQLVCLCLSCFRKGVYVRALCVCAWVCAPVLAAYPLLTYFPFVFVCLDTVLQP